MDVRIRVKTDAFTRFGLLFALQDANSYYRLGLSKQKSHFKLEKVLGGTFTELAGSTRTFISGEWTNLRVVLHQGIIVAYANGEQVLAAADNTFSGGKLALWGGVGRAIARPVFYDNLYFLSAPRDPVLAILTPALEFAVLPDGTIPVSARVINGSAAAAVRFTIDGGSDPSRPALIENSAPFDAVFAYGPLPPAPEGPGEHQLLVELLDSGGSPLASPEASVRRLVLGVNGINAVLVGDSISTGVGDDDSDPQGSSPDVSDDGRNSGGGFGPILNNALTDAGLGPVTIIHGGNPGDKAFDAIAKTNAIVARNPNATAFLVMFGSNDAYGSTPVLPDDFQANLQQVVQALESTGADVYVATTPAVDEASVGDNNRNETLSQYRTKIIELVDTYSPTNGRVLHGPDFFTRFEATLGLPTSDDLLGSDGLHPDGDGYAAMGEDWEQCMEVGCDYL
jgi:lysophospholipase L1-like esterase